MEWPLEDLATAVQTAVGGRLAGYFREGGEQFPITVRLQPVDRLTAQDLDRWLLADLHRATWDSIALDLRARLSDGAIDAALGRLPAEYLRLEGEQLRTHLRSRRDLLPEVAAEFYEVLMREPEVNGRDTEDVAEIVAAVRGTSGPVSIGGGRFSMGGQTATEGALHVDMRPGNEHLVGREDRRVLAPLRGQELGRRQCFVRRRGRATFGGLGSARAFALRGALGCLASPISSRSILGARLRNRCPQYGHSVMYGETSAPQDLQTTKRSGEFTCGEPTPR